MKTKPNSAKKHKELRRKKSLDSVPVSSAKPYPKTKYEGVVKHRKPLVKESKSL